MPSHSLFVLLVAGLAALGQFAIATYLPAFDAIGAELAASPACSCWPSTAFPSAVAWRPAAT